MKFRHLALAITTRIISRLPSSSLQVHARHWVHMHLMEPERSLQNLDSLLGSNRGIAVDVGANFGYYSIELLKRFEKVVAFEVNGVLANELKCVSKRLEVHDVGLSSSCTSAILKMPILGKKELVGWASLESGNCPGADTYVESRVELRTLDSFDLETVDFLKIDVEGHELQVLKGAVQTLRRCKPRILIEVKERDHASVMAFLEQEGYHNVDLRPLIGGDDGENHLFAPVKD